MNGDLSEKENKWQKKETKTSMSTEKKNYGSRDEKSENPYKCRMSLCFVLNGIAKFISRNQLFNKALLTPFEQFEYSLNVVN